MERKRSLRESLNWVLALLALLAILASGTVLASLGAINDTHQRLEISSRSLRAADLSTITLLRELVEDDASTQAELRRSTFIYLDRIRRLSDTEEELALIMETEQAVTAYYAVPEDDPRARELLIEAFQHVSALVELNISQFNDALEEADALSRSTRLAAAGAAIAMVGGAILVAMGIRYTVYAPFRELLSALSRFGAGDLSVRAPERGPSEIQTIASTFNSTASRLQEQQDSRIAFLAGIAHDLRNPIHALRLSLAIIKPDEPLPEESRLRRVLDTMAQQLAQLERMVGDLLEVQRVQSGTASLQLARHDLRGLAQASVDLHEAMAARHRLELHAPEPVMAVCDGLRIQQVLNNLIGNALKYSHQGTVRVSIEQDGDFARIAVSDEGPGVPETDRERIFQPYHRGSTDPRAVSGSGLGLYVSRQIATAHGGRLELASEPRRGATFTLVLPLAGPR